jgi:predicted glycoside hydrolase/deacetylase ChbG (UPF0249 family)
MMKLIISADDFGLSPGINKAIVELFENDMDLPVVLI